MGRKGSQRAGETELDAIIVKACLNGMRGREGNPAVPWTPKEIAREARRCADAGATALHFHARGPAGEISYDPAWYSEANRLIRAECNLVLNHTTARFPGAPIEAVLGYLRQTEDPPEMVSLNPGQLVFQMPLEGGTRRTLAIPNSYDEIRQIVEVCTGRGITPEATVLDSGFLSNVAMLVEDGVIETPRYLLLEFSGRFGDGMQVMPGDARGYRYLCECVGELFPDAFWLAHGIEDSAYRVAELAIEDGAHVRIGFEDRVTLPDGRPAASNAEMVAWVVERARAAGRDVASPEQARRRLLGGG